MTVFTFSPEEYEYVWGGQGFSLLFQSLYFDAIKKFKFVDAFGISKDNDLSVYFSRAALLECALQGKQYFTDKAAILAFCEQAQRAADDVLATNPTDDLFGSWKTFISLSSAFMYEYTKLDPYFSDPAFTQVNDAETLGYLGQVKNILREKLNNIFFTESSTLFKFLKPISETLKTNPTSLQYVSVQDISESLGGISGTLFQTKDFLISIKDGVYSYTYDKDQIESILGKFKIEKPDSIEEIVGMSVSQKGIYTGKVKKVVLDYLNLEKTIQASNQEDGGFVLVADHTVPELLPIMKKSTAIVTDLGGILSHAAITARELKIPCIVGTKNAMRFLHDGDMVEVDADNGIVTILQ